MANILSETEVIQIENRALEGGAEQRQYTRRIGRWSFTGLTQQKNTFKGQTENISEGGVLLVVDNPPEELQRGEQIYIEIRFSHRSITKKIKVVAKIKHAVFYQSQKKIGVKYLEIADEDRKLLNTYANHKI